MKKYLISYGDDHYIKQRERFKASAEASAFFDDIQIFSTSDIDPVFYKKVYEPIKFGRGGGYWIWKPYFIKRVLDTLEIDDLLVYCDIGCTINSSGKQRFEEYIDILASSKTGSIDFGLSFKEYQFTKKEVFDHFGSSNEIINSTHLVGGIQILRKCSHTIKIVNKWYDTAVNYPFLFTDEKQIPQHPGFIAHRNDQSIFSVIRNTYGANIIPDETYFSDFVRDGHRFPFWATRLRG